MYTMTMSSWVLLVAGYGDIYSLPLKRNQSIMLVGHEDHLQS
jgi:hypothetical protein